MPIKSELKPWERSTCQFFVFVLLAFLSAVGIASLWGTDNNAAASTSTGSPQLYLPLIAKGAVPVSSALTCRMGYTVVRNPITTYDTATLQDLRGGIYLNYGTSNNPAQPLGIEYIQVIHIKQEKNGNQYDSPYVVPYTYTVSPAFGTLRGLVQNNPGALWLVGNEPDRRDWRNSDGSVGSQDEMVPELYAQAYYEIYTAIKSADPTARVATAGLIEGTPLRIEYLNRMWNAYRARYGTTMPVDVWNTHEFILPESANPLDAGAGVPSGIDAPTGRWFTDWSTWVVSSPLFIQDITALRNWLASVGQRDKPLLISEQGVMPDWINSDASASSYMNTTFAWLLNQTDSNVGYPADGNRLIQGTVWFSLDDDQRDPTTGDLYWGGHLLNSMTHARDPLGVTWYNFVQTLPVSQPDLVPAHIVQPFIPLLISGTTTVNVVVEVVNAGNTGTGSSFAVTLRDENNNVVDTQTMPALKGCAMERRQVTFTVPNVTPGSHTVTVQVNSTGSIPESNTNNNSMTGKIFVATSRLYLPLMDR